LQEQLKETNSTLPNIEEIEKGINLICKHQKQFIIDETLLIKEVRSSELVWL